ncbi:nitronate monooxygenase family protein [Clostridium sp. MSJ-11]|uniref:Nitronate monooxygenase family protein n=1 Tax=Clostridium mobile TaxID=2841512 RepID=A0ABS6EM99_9CLOT|nr:nitronate monooxygenase family protein [Clostridium mobile]MBU5486360.1 nitronate monooxygenase family protein [Clostridium mobile]
MKISPLQIGNLEAKIPIIQGGMGIGVSLSKLAAAVANEGGIGIISGVQIGFNEEDFETNSKEANIRALKNEIRKSKKLSPLGIIGVNLMVAMNNYDEMAKAAVEEGIDVIISGAGIPKNLPDLVKGSKTKIAPIVSSGKAAKIICKLWYDKYSYLPDFIVVEGSEAGGHLGFNYEELIENNDLTLEKILKEVIEEVKYFENKYEKNIPIIAAGGIYTGKDIEKYLKLGAHGVQMATRFICTEECDAHINYKRCYLECKEENIDIIKSPVGLPGRAIINNFIKEIEKNRDEIDRCYGCLKKCNPKTTIYCISKALINAVRGNVEEGLLFIGSKGYKMNKIVTVKELIEELIEEVKDCE